MKILMLGWELPPNNSGGLGVACLQMCSALASKGADIEFVVPYTDEHDIDFMTVTSARPVSVTEVVQAGGVYDSYKYTFQDGTEEWLDIFGQQRMYENSIGGIVEEAEFDVIHAHDWLTFRAALRAKEKSNKPLILHVHSIETDRAGGNTGNPLVREIEATALMIADQVIAVSEHTKKAIIHEYGIPADKIIVVHNSIDPSVVDELDADNAYNYCQAMKEQGYKVVTNVGRLTIQKGLPSLLRAAQEVVNHEPKTLFLIVGSGEQYYELIELAADLGIGRNVIFTGFQRGKRWRDAFAVADLFVMPSVSEPFGLTPLEAVSYGTPSLISKQSGVNEVLKSCLRVDHWDEQSMANQIVSALRSDALRQELLSGAQKEYQSMSWNRSADKLMNVYDRHLGAVAV